MTDHDDKIGASPFDLAANIDYSDGAIVSKTLLEKKTGTLTVFAFDKGQGLSEHVAPFDATVFVLEGSAEITVGAKAMRVGSQQLLVMPANVPHAVHASERFKMLLIMIRG